MIDHTHDTDDEVAVEVLIKMLKDVPGNRGQGVSAQSHSVRMSLDERNENREIFREEIEPGGPGDHRFVDPVVDREVDRCSQSGAQNRWLPSLWISVI